MPYYSPDNAKTGRPKIREFWVEYIAQLMNMERLTSPIEIFRRLEAYAEKNDLGDLPSERTVNRRIAENRHLVDRGDDAPDPKNERFAWPDSMGQEEYQVPWVAARDALDLLRWYLGRNYRRPTVRVVQWYARISLASGDVQVGILGPEPRLREAVDDRTIENRLRRAVLLALGDVNPRPNLGLPSYKEHIELELAFQPERSLEDRQAYDKVRASLKFDEALGATRPLPGE
jgi:hypothetical protein